MRNLHNLLLDAEPYEAPLHPAALAAVLGAGGVGGGPGMGLILPSGGLSPPAGVSRSASSNAMAAGRLVVGVLQCFGRLPCGNW